MSDIFILFLVLITGSGTYCQTDNNHTAAVGDVPYIVSIWQVSESALHPSANNTDFKCAGVLITNQHVLTTINCVEQAEHGYGHVVSAGHVSRGDVTSLQFHDVTEVIRHELYNNVTKEYDVAILKIPPGIVTGPTVRPIKVQQFPRQVGTRCTVSGWRRNFFYTSNDLRVNDVLLLNDASWPPSVYHQLDDPGYSGDVDRMIMYGGIKVCAGVEDTASCNVGDEGGPLVCDDALVGLYSSYGTICLDTDPEPSLYHDLSYYANWILLHAPGVELGTGAGVMNQNYPLLILVMGLTAVIYV